MHTLPRPNSLLAALAAVLLFSLTAVPSPAAANEAEQRNALATFQQARSGGGDDSIEAAATQLLAVSRSEPGHPLWLAYAGSATTMQARTTWQPWKKMAYVEDGLALIDKALALLTPAHMSQLHNGVPVALETRLTAASTFLALPSMFNRGDRGRRLLEDLQKDTALASTPAAFQEAVRKLAAKVKP